MDNAVMAYLADKILQDLRNGVQLDEALCASITRFSNFDVLRGAVRPDDVDILIRLAALPQTNLAALALGLLQPLESDPRVSAFLRSAWQEAESFYRK